jgi:uncharacterized membrane protein
MDEKNNKQKPVIKRIGGYLHKLTPIVDSTGKIISHTITPFMVEFRPRDLMQVIVGASILAVPVAFTEETWKLGEELALKNVLYLCGISLFFIAMYVYFNFYRFQLKDHVFEYIKRVLATYFCSFIIVGLLLTIIQRCPWSTDSILAIKRIIIVTFPASMSAALSDTIK